LLVDREAALVQFFVAAGPPDSLESSLPRLESEAELIGPFEWKGLIDFGWAEHGRQTGVCERAIPLYERALEARPEDRGPVYRGYADCLLSVGRTDDAVLALEAALEWSASDAAAHLALARLLQESGDLEAARSHLDESLRIWSLADPTFTPAAEAGALLASLGEPPS
jgi:tetratricopeptide (TPR) repeat protein